MKINLLEKEMLICGFIQENSLFLKIEPSRSLLFS